MYKVLEIFTFLFVRGIKGGHLVFLIVQSLPCDLSLQKCFQSIDKSRRLENVSKTTLPKKTA